MAYLSKTYSQDAGARKIFTVSAWVKRSKLGTNQDCVSAFRSSDGFQTDVIRFQSSDAFQFYAHTTNSSGNAQLTTNRLFRDVNSWYHIVVRVDTTQSTSSDRIRLYVNGEQETSFSTANYMSQNGEIVWGIGSGVSHQIGAVGGSNNFKGLMTHIHYCDGQSLAPTSFGSTDNTTGIWKPITNPSVTYGTNGFFLNFEDSSNFGDDTSGNGNDYTLTTGTITQTIDTPSNIFATLNPLQYTGATVPNHTFSNGNLSVSTTTTSGADSNVFGTLGVSQGKWYYEYKFTGGNTGMAAGWRGEDGDRMAYYSGNGYKYDESGSSAYGASYTTNDIIGVAADLDNGNLTFYKNGTSQGEITNAFTLADGQYYQPFLWDGSGSLYITCDVNFGNGYFGTTAVSSAGTNAGIGTFEYDVPSGYKALCTKNINAEEYS